MRTGTYGNEKNSHHIHEVILLYGSKNQNSFKIFSNKIHILRKKLFQMQSIPSLQLNSLRRYRQIKELAHMEMEKIATIFKVVFFSMNPKIENVWIFFQIRFINYPKSCFKLDQSHLSSCIRWGGICKSRLLAHMEMGKIATTFKVVFFFMDQKIKSVSNF